MKMSTGGTATSILREMETSGFITSYIPFGKRSSDALYRISDEFILFHLHWIAPLGKQQAGHGYWTTKQSGTKYNAWSGYSFEGICLKHIGQIKYHMRIDMIDSNESPWEYRSEFTINAAYAKDLRRKMEVFRTQTGTRKSLFLTMVTTFGLNDKKQV